MNFATMTTREIKAWIARRHMAIFACGRLAPQRMAALAEAEAILAARRSS